MVEDLEVKQDGPWVKEECRSSRRIHRLLSRTLWLFMVQKNFRNRRRVLKEEDGPCARSVPSYTKVVGNWEKRGVEQHEWQVLGGSLLANHLVGQVFAKLVANQTCQNPSTLSQWPFLGHRQQRVSHAHGHVSRWVNNETWPRKQPLSRRKVPPPIQDGQPESAPVRASNRQIPPCLHTTSFLTCVGSRPRLVWHGHVVFHSM